MRFFNFRLLFKIKMFMSLTLLRVKKVKGIRNQIKTNQVFREVLLSTIQSLDGITKSRVKQGLIACKLLKPENLRS